MTMMISVESIRNEPGGQLCRTLPVEIPSFRMRGAEMEILEDSEMAFHVYRLEGGWYLMGQGDVSIRTVCSRCLEEAELTVPISFSEEIPDQEVEIRPAAREDRGLRPEGVVPDLRDDYQIDVTQRVREEIILAIPLKVTCGSECRGLCPECGTNLNREACECEDTDIDPRMAELEELKRSLSEGGGR